MQQAATDLLDQLLKLSLALRPLRAPAPEPAAVTA
jgi:hypothetical protein